MNGKAIKRKAFQVLGHNLTQEIVDKFMRLSKTGFLRNFLELTFRDFLA